MAGFARPIFPVGGRGDAEAAAGRAACGLRGGIKGTSAQNRLARKCIASFLDAFKPN